MIHRLSSWFDGIDAVEMSLHDFAKLISSRLRDEPLASIVEVKLRNCDVDERSISVCE